MLFVVLKSVAHKFAAHKFAARSTASAATLCYLTHHLEVLITDYNFNNFDKVEDVPVKYSPFGTSEWW